MSARFWSVASFALAACAPAVAPVPSVAAPSPSASAASSAPVVTAPSGPSGPERLCDGTAAQRKETCGACAADVDCEVTNFSSCCSSCEASPHVMTKAQLRAHTARCAVVDCEMRNVRCEPVEPASAYRAICREGACDAVRIASQR